MSACLSGNRKRNEKIVIHTLEFTRIQVKILTRKNWGNSTKLGKKNCTGYFIFVHYNNLLPKRPTSIKTTIALAIVIEGSYC